MEKKKDNVFIKHLYEDYACTRNNPTFFVFYRVTEV